MTSWCSGATTSGNGGNDGGVAINKILIDLMIGYLQYPFVCSAKTLICRHCQLYTMPKHKRIEDVILLGRVKTHEYESDFDVIWRYEKQRRRRW